MYILLLCFFTWDEMGKSSQRVHNGEDRVEIVVGVMSMKSMYKVSLATCGIGMADKIPRSGAVIGFDRRQASQEQIRDFDMSNNS